MVCLFYFSLAAFIVFITFLTGVDPGFLKGGFICVEEGVRFAGFISIFIITHGNEIIWSQ